MSEDLWYYTDDNNEVVGPMSFRDVEVLLRTDTISLSTNCWKSDMETWQHIGQVPEFIQSLAENDIEIALHLKPTEPTPENFKEQKVKSPQKTQELKKKKHKKQKAKKLNKWYNPKKNTNLYISGLPSSISLDKVKEFLSKAGVIRVDKFTGLPKIKLYHDEEGRLKGDGLVSYMNSESLSMAINILDKKEIEPGFQVHLEPAEFCQKGEYIARKKVEVNKLELIKARSVQERLMGWTEEVERKGLRIVILTNIFKVEEYNESVKEKLKNFVEENIGQIERIKVFQFNPEGVVEIKFTKASEAEACIQEFNNKQYLGRMTKCFYWDGTTDYRRFRESAEDEKKRIEEFGEFLEQSSSED